MKSRNIRYIVLILALVFAGALFVPPLFEDNSEDPFNEKKNLDYISFSVEVCKCIEPVIELNAQLIAEKRKGRYGKKMESLIDQATQRNIEAKSCCLALKKQLSRQAVEKVKFNNALEENCPDIPELLLNELNTWFF